MRIDELLTLLRAEKIETWFDLGLYLDRFKEEQPFPSLTLDGTYDDFRERVGKGGVAFMTYHYMVDGVTMEVEKYASLLRKSIPAVPIHYIAGEIHEKTAPIIPADYQRKVIPELAGFDEWELYHDFYFTRLERGSETYNSLINKLWSQTLDIIEKLGSYVQEEDIRLFYLLNVASNPGNVAFTLACVLLSEYLEIPVINNNHDFYWEGGNCKLDKDQALSKSGPRDFFFTNCHLGEVFSIIEVLFPWRSRSWINVNINRAQTEHLINENGHNPASVMDIGTAVDTRVYTKNDKRKNINTIIQVKQSLSRYGDKLISYSVDDVTNGQLVTENSARPILIGARTAPVDRFIRENIILLQPTRILSRKRIETSFNLLLKMFQEKDMIKRFKHTSHLKMTLLITGPIANGHYAYFQKLIRRFNELLEQADPELKNRIYLALLFGELDRDSFKARFDEPAGIPELYNIASLVLLPSKTEGRGLPIIEATACGTPIFCRRYEPEEVYSEVIGEHLGERDRLKVLEFKGHRITDTIVKNIQERIFFPHHFTDEFTHNKRVVDKRYSLDALHKNMEEVLQGLFQLLKNDKKIERVLVETLDDYREMIAHTSDDLDALLNTSYRHYLPGYGRLSYMLKLKALIDPSYFRIEQQEIRGMAFAFSRTIIQNDPDAGFVPDKIINRFYNAVEHIFEYREGIHEIQHDHSMSYRHRNAYHYPYQDFTFQELTGWINLLYMNIVQPTPINRIDLTPQFFTDWNLALMQLTGSTYLAIDDRKRLIKELSTNRPIAYFPGAYILYELEFFALQSIRSRLELPLEVVISRELLEKEAKNLKPVYIFAQEKNLGKQLNKDEITDYIANGNSEELRLLYEFKVIQIVRTKQVCLGIHFPQLGTKALKILRKIKDEKGYLLTNRRNAAPMTDLVDMDRFHIGKVVDEYAAHIMGIPLESGYIQFVPAGLRPTLAYPTPVQTARDFEKALKSESFRKLSKKLGEEVLLEKMRKDALRNGSPIKHFLATLENEKAKKGAVNYTYISGLHQDGQPYNGVMATLNFKEQPWDFAAISSPDSPRTVQKISKNFARKTGKKPLIAWNGGYILNPELVGKLGIAEAYIGSPLGLIISEGQMLSAPLFNKPALLIQKDGSINISRVHCRDGLRIVHEGTELVFKKSAYNRAGGGSGPAYYDLLYKEEKIEADGRTLVRLSGREVKEIKKTTRGESVQQIPVGLTFVLPPEMVPMGLKTGSELELHIPGLENVEHGVEAGPLLLDEGALAIDMEAEGWKHVNSIRTQAARLDYTDMRGPKIAAGINTKGELAVLAINGRIRESAGATHSDMAIILEENGMNRAMGFDPGGSSTLVVGGVTLNISPYNKEYEKDHYAMSPEPRGVSNAIIGYLK